MKDLKIAIILMGVGALFLASVIYFNTKDIAKNEKKVETIESRLDSLEIAIYSKWEWNPETKKWETSK